MNQPKDVLGINKTQNSLYNRFLLDVAQGFT